ncbi:magnesium transporter [Tsukamurella sp. 8F]|uniref:general stress protein n=1 Tax=unclassified Tsukamurella TaxID=2633480 RepID=UPI0023B902CE|nr:MULTISPECIES: general stress protein [unclassified Tsukamurella]MDF0530360.1 magnesium transporter [Tsukamurella sp. 8J]MDF0587657.1 magnesium transporter [Tsukamurella sp. 8F]
MTSPIPGGSPNARNTARGLPTPPRGWPIGSYGTYAEAQRAVDYLSDEQFPVEDVTIVGVDLMQVEKVTGRLTWGRVLGAGVASGAWLGLFFGLLVGLFTGHALGSLIAGLAGGIVFGVISTAIPYAATRGTRDFSSTMQLVAGRYDVICEPRSAERARDMLARLNID